ncbi:MAG: chemotaxis protein CheZ, partial [Desulfovibrio sp.]|nr:chemotaxis protein CheZ [Desulfovibrio sp.]
MSQSNEPLYKQLSTEMRAGLKDIYQQLSSASQQNFPMAEPETRTLFREATSQLDQVLRSTEEATTNLLELIEQNQ